MLESIYAYFKIEELPSAFTGEQRALAHECARLVALVQEHDRDVAVQDEDLRFYSVLRRARDIEARLAYETFHGFAPLLPEFFEITPDELKVMDNQFHAQFMGL